MFSKKVTNRYPVIQAKKEQNRQRTIVVNSIKELFSGYIAKINNLLNNLDVEDESL